MTGAVEATMGDDLISVVEERRLRLDKGARALTVLAGGPELDAFRTVCRRSRRPVLDLDARVRVQELLSTWLQRLPTEAVDEAWSLVGSSTGMDRNQLRSRLDARLPSARRAWTQEWAENDDQRVAVWLVGLDLDGMPASLDGGPLGPLQLVPAVARVAGPAAPAVLLNVEGVAGANPEHRIDLDGVCESAMQVGAALTQLLPRVPIAVAAQAGVIRRYFEVGSESAAKALARDGVLSWPPGQRRDDMADTWPLSRREQAGPDRPERPAASRPAPARPAPARPLPARPLPERPLPAGRQAAEPPPDQPTVSLPRHNPLRDAAGQPQPSSSRSGWDPDPSGEWPPTTATGADGNGQCAPAEPAPSRGLPRDRVAAPADDERTHLLARQNRPAPAEPSSRRGWDTSPGDEPGWAGVREPGQRGTVAGGLPRRPPTVAIPPTTPPALKSPHLPEPDQDRPAATPGPAPAPTPAEPVPGVQLPSPPANGAAAALAGRRRREDAAAALRAALEADPRTRGRFAQGCTLEVRSSRQLVVELVCEQAGLVVEVDDNDTTDPDTHRRRQRRDLLLQLDGWVVLRVLACDIVDDPAKMATLAAGAMTVRLRRAGPGR